MTSVIHNINIDCADPYLFSLFWAEVTGWTEHPDEGNAPEDPEALLISPDGSLNLLFIAAGRQDRQEPGPSRSAADRPDPRRGSQSAVGTRCEPDRRSAQTPMNPAGPCSTIRRVTSSASKEVQSNAAPPTRCLPQQAFGVVLWSAAGVRLRLTWCPAKSGVIPALSRNCDAPQGVSQVA